MHVHVHRERGERRERREREGKRERERQGDREEVLSTNPNRYHRRGTSYTSKINISNARNQKSSITEYYVFLRSFGYKVTCYITHK